MTDRFNLTTQREPGWIERADLAARMLSALRDADPSVQRLADIGCGDRKLARALEAAGLTMDYEGYDLLPQHESVQRFDLDSDRLDHPVDAVALLGVTEYLRDFRSALERLRASSRYVLLSHVLRGPRPPTPQRLAELGWVNHLSDGELRSLVADAGFEICQQDMTPDGKTRVLCGRRT